LEAEKTKRAAQWLRHKTYGCLL